MIDEIVTLITHKRNKVLHDFKAIRNKQLNETKLSFTEYEKIINNSKTKIEILDKILLEIQKMKGDVNK